MVDGGGGEVAVIVARLLVERGWGWVVRALPWSVFLFIYSPGQSLGEREEFEQFEDV